MHPQSLSLRERLHLSTYNYILLLSVFWCLQTYYMS
nr:MAG TPA: hypothetical protein [Caudoviricetes sp.]